MAYNTKKALFLIEKGLKREQGAICYLFAALDSGRKRFICAIINKNSKRLVIFCASTGSIQDSIRKEFRA